MFGGGDLVLDLPAAGTHGYAFMLFGPTPQAEAQLAALKAVLAASLPGRTPRPMRALALRGAALTATAALLVWLALPAPLKVTATATSLPASAQAMALPFEAFLEQMHVRVGDQVAAGDPIADLRAPNLLDQRADLVAQIAIEEVSAQSALSANDYGAYVLSEQKIAQNRKRLDQLEERLAQLRLRAPFDARVVQALGHEVLGAYQPTGENIAVVQPENRYAARLKIARVDAPLLQVGQSGEIWFRGISGQEWQLNVTSAPSLTVDPTTGEEELTLKAELLGQDQARLFAGLTGFARIEAGEQMRALVLSRYAREYIRMKLWTWFDFQL
ncbi:MAG: HlyD family efflux transporter periplasmic adaptor subunit, partial [Pseudomonadota bacterium]|nr:HlyD family efflux transporter periplasmic adaptor subunit [Pseudomonadota bacterium]